jgi:hypothetical protein
MSKFENYSVYLLGDALGGVLTPRSRGSRSSVYSPPHWRLTPGGSERRQVGTVRWSTARMLIEPLGLRRRAEA